MNSETTDRACNKYIGMRVIYDALAVGRASASVRLRKRAREQNVDEKAGDRESRATAPCKGTSVRVRVAAFGTHVRERRGNTHTHTHTIGWAIGRTKTSWGCSADLPPSLSPPSRVPEAMRGQFRAGG